jgi:L-fuculose-phosphate aldolase
MAPMQLETERGDVVRYCRQMGATGLTPGTSGNISIFNRAAGLMAISPSAMRYDELTPADVVVMDLDARAVEGARRPSTEFGMHLACYRRRGDINAVVHTHSPAATTMAALGWELPAVHYVIAFSGGARVRCAPYHLFGTPALAQAAVEHLGDGYACLLESHGALATGPHIGHAFALAEQLEFCAALYLRARSVGTPKVLSDGQIAEVIGSFSRYQAQS